MRQSQLILLLIFTTQILKQFIFQEILDTLKDPG